LHDCIVAVQCLQCLQCSPVGLGAILQRVFLHCPLIDPGSDLIFQVKGLSVQPACSAESDL